MKRRTFLLAIVGIALLGALVAGCSSDATTPSSGNVSVLLTDAPIDFTGVSAVNVTLTGMTLYPSADSEGGPLPMHMGVDPATPINLLDLQNGTSAIVGMVDAPPGDYRRIRLEIGSAEIARDDDGDATTPDVVEPIYVPSSKVDVPVPFTVSGGEDVEVTLDFNAQLSVQVNETPGQEPYILRPVIAPVGMTSN